jgi:putative peptidoglycan lipid II flippase
MPINSVKRSESAKVARSAGVVSIAIFLSRITGLIREMVMAQKFGAGLSYDAFLLGFRIPNLTRNLFAEGALSSAFVPIFAAALASGDRQAAERLSNLVGAAILMFVGLFCIVGIVFSPQLVWLLAPGYAQVPGKFELAVRMTRIMFPFLLLVALAAQAMGMLNACDKFGVPAMASTFFNLGSVILGLALGFWLGPHLGILPIEGMAYGVVLGGALQLAWQIPSLRRLGFRFRFEIDWHHPGLQKIFRLMIPAIVGSAAVQINVLVNTNFASQISDPVRGADGPVSWLAYAFRFMQFPLGIFGVSFASAILPSVSRSVAANDYGEFRRTMSRSLGLIFLMTIPSSIGLILLGTPIIGAVFQGGKFQIYDTRQTAVALSCYSIGLVGYAATKVLNPAFYALTDAKTPMYVSLCSIGINILFAEVLLRKFQLGIAALALSTSAVAMAAFVILFYILRRRIGGIDGRYLAERFLRVAAASIVMAVPVWFCNIYLTRWLGQSRWGDLANLAVSLPVGIATFTLAANWLGIEEIRFARDIFSRRLTSLRARIMK